jgi:hypothetical protein
LSVNRCASARSKQMLARLAPGGETSQSEPGNRHRLQPHIFVLAEYAVCPLRAGCRRDGIAAQARG